MTVTPNNDWLAGATNSALQAGRIDRGVSLNPSVRRQPIAPFVALAQSVTRDGLLSRANEAWRGSIVQNGHVLHIPADPDGAGPNGLIRRGIDVGFEGGTVGVVDQEVDGRAAAEKRFADDATL